MTVEVLDTKRVKKMTGNKVLLDWEEAKPEWLKGKLLRPETHRGQHYTGIVLAVGPDVDPEIKVGKRVFFEQFSSPIKYEDPNKGRVCIVRDEAILAIVPPRTNIETEEGDYDYEN